MLKVGQRWQPPYFSYFTILVLLTFFSQKQKINISGSKWRKLVINRILRLIILVFNLNSVLILFKTIYVKSDYDSFFILSFSNLSIFF